MGWCRQTNLDQPLQNNLANLFLVIYGEFLLCHKNAVAAEKLNVSPPGKSEVNKLISLTDNQVFFGRGRLTATPTWMGSSVH